MATIKIHSCTTFIILLLVAQNSILSDSKTLESDIIVLQSIKQSIDPNSITPNSFLNTWNFKNDPCETTGIHFLGILCTIPETINSSSRVTAIDLEGDGLEGFLTPILGNLTELTLLNLKKNRFRGPIPNSVTNLKRLTRLLLSDNFFSGSIPSGFSTLKRLETIDLSLNRLSGSIPTSISSFRGLNQLTMSNNAFSGKIPNLRGLWQLNSLDLSSNQLYGNLPQLPTNLKSLSLAHNLLSGHVLSINRLRKLNTLDLSDNRLSGSINQEIFKLHDLTFVNVSSNVFTTIEVAKMANKPSQLRAIEAQNNRIRGHLPLNLISYENLNSVNLGHNLFRGVIPKEYGRGWRSLFLDYNFLEGKLPLGFRSGGRTRGSLAHNCLNCPNQVEICGGGQRPPSECIAHDHDV
ncbi:hypothetical protein ACJIZ3_018017 [Penstemon smallii]|uniref:Leucine-rich repeat-containing N-terminal plant-type domain-containing protein n=1 Tax=Penstemon smallii TaxID=265156 RepID=A0ABD3SXM8_9LAMI